MFIFIGGLVILLMVFRGDTASGEIDWARLVYLTVLLSIISMGFGGAFANNIGTTLKHIAIWVAIGATIALTFSFYQELRGAFYDVSGRLDPSSARETDHGIVVFASQDGHFFVRAEAEGRSILFLVDTGASDVVLSHSDAEKLRYNIGDLNFSRSYQTANGIGRGAPITIEGIGIGSIYVRNVRGTIMEKDSQVSLLGMSFLRELGGYEVKTDRLVLYP